MRGFSARTLTVTAALAVAIAGVAVAEKPTVVEVGSLVFTLNGGFTPKKLPRATRAGITLNVSGKIETGDGTHPPPLNEFIFDADRDGAINAKGLRVCTAAKLQAQDTAHAEAVCPTAIVGEGKTDVEVEFPESKPFIAKSKLLAFNGGVSGGVTTIYIHAYLSSPVSAAVVAPVKVSKIHKSRFGLESIATIPKIAGGSGSAVSFELELGRAFTYKGKPQNYLLAKCPDGHLNAHASAVFKDGSRLTGSFVRSCKPRD